MWTEPGSEQTPDALDGIDVHFVHAVSIGVAGIFSFTVMDRDMDIAPTRKASVDAVLVGVDRAALLDHGRDPGLNGGLLDVAAQPKETRPPSRDHPQHRGFVCRRSASASFAFSASTPTYTPLSWSEQRG